MKNKTVNNPDAFLNKNDIKVPKMAHRIERTWGISEKK